MGGDVVAGDRTRQTRIVDTLQVLGHGEMTPLPVRLWEPPVRHLLYERLDELVLPTLG